MNEETEQSLYRLWTECRVLYGANPSESEWEDFVREHASAGDSCLSHLSQSEISECAREAFKNFEICEIEEDEIAVKARNANANMHCRRYVDGTF